MTAAGVKVTETGKRPKEFNYPPDLPARLAAAESQASIARSLDVSPNTVNVWAHLPEVTEAVESIRAEMLADAKRQLASLRTVAVSTVADVMVRRGPYVCRCGEEVVCGCGEPVTYDVAPPKDRLRAAEMVMDRAGLPRTEVTEHSGSVGLVGPLQTVERIDVLTTAAEILEADGFGEAAAVVRAAIGGAG